MLLIDDPEKTVIEPLTAAAGQMETLYDFDLDAGRRPACGAGA